MPFVADYRGLCLLPFAFLLKCRPGMVERPDFEFPKPAPGHSRTILETSKFQVRRLVQKTLAGEPEPIQKAGAKITNSMICIDLRLGDPAYNEARALREANKILVRAQMEAELGRVLQLIKKAYDTAVYDVEHPPSAFSRALSQVREPKKERKDKQVPDEMRPNIPFGTDLNALYESAQRVLLRNYVLRRQLGDELYSKFTEAVLTLFRRETLSRSALIAQGLKPDLVHNQFKSILGAYNIARFERRRRMR